MSGLFGSLQMAARSLAAQQAGLDLAGQNIANLNTPGYARRRLELAEVVYGARGVEVLGTRALRDAVLDRRVRTALPDEAREGAIAGALAVVETAIGAPGAGLDARFTAFFDAFAALSLDPTSAVARDAVVQQGRALAQGFHDTEAQLTEARVMADRGVREGVSELNALTAEIADLNRAIASANGVDVEALKSRQQIAVERLAGLTAVTVLPRSDGGVDVTIPSGRALVIGEADYAVEVTTGLDGDADLSLGGYAITTEITSGRIGGLIHARDSAIPGYLQQLDAMAYAVVQQVNTVHQAGFDANGVAGVAFFTPLGSATGAAAAIGMSAAVSANPALVAASGTGAPGDNQAAKAMAALRDAGVLAGGATFAEGWAQLAYTVGSDASTAQIQFEARGAVRADVERLRDQVSGVSLDEEAASLLKFQRAYEANAKFFTTVDSVLQTLMDMVGVR